jgi:hypothetical protein
MKRLIRKLLGRVRQWLAEPPPAGHERPISFDNSYLWIGQTFRRIVEDPLGGRYRPYAWGVLQGAALAKVLGYSRITAIEFGVAGGSGLLSLERVAELVEQEIGVGIDVYGFDAGKGLPKPLDYRDVPYMWEEGDFAMDEQELRSRLKRAQLKLGLVDQTVPEFVRTSFPPVAFISFDLDLYSGTKQAFRLLEAEADKLLPRVFCYFDDIMGFGYNDFTGERLAVHEFNGEHALRKLAPIYGLKWFVPQEYFNDRWIEMLQIAHLFDHPLYGKLEHLHRGGNLNVEGQWRWKE